MKFFCANKKYIKYYYVPCITCGGLGYVEGGGTIVGGPWSFVSIFIQCEKGEDVTDGCTCEAEMFEPPKYGF